jgi:RNA polymerase sigma factor (sigma-70 family)
MGKILQLFGHETQLIRGLRDSDPKAQRLLYEKFSGKMLAICLRYVGDRMTAEDILIQGFMKVFESVGRFREDGSFEGWVKRIMVNEALGYLRRNRKLLESVGVEEAGGLADAAYADQHLEASEILAIIDRLPFGYRTVFNLYAIEGFSHTEIAAMLGISEGTSKSQLHRARSHLQQMVKEWERDDRQSKDSKYTNNRSTSV